MKRPNIICYMMTSVDGRIDCAMTEQLPGGESYYALLEGMETPTTICGRNTAELEMALPGRFQPADQTPYGKEGFSRAAEAAGYEIIADSRGRLLWPDAGGMERPYLILTSETVSREYLDYLDERQISWIAAGRDGIDLPRAMELLAAEFGVERLAVVGGPTLNTAFLKAGLLDEVSILIGSGIDGRGSMPAVFDGLPMNYPVTPLTLLHVQAMEDGAVWLRYKTNSGQ